MADRTFEELIETVYESLLDDSVSDRLPSVLATYCQARSASMLIWQSPVQLQKILSVSYLPDAFWHEYRKDFYDKDLWAQSLVLAPPNRAVALERYVSKRSFLASAIYNELVRKHGDDTVHCMAAWLPLGDGVMSTIGLHRSLRAGEFSSALQRRLQRALPHLKRLVMLWRKLGHATRESRLSEAVLDAVGTGILVLDEHGTVVFGNTAATKLLRHNDGLGCRSGRLVAADHATTIKLEVLVRRLVVNPATEPAPALQVPRRSGARPLCVTLIPLPRSVSLSTDKVLAVVDDPERFSLPSEAALRALLDLTTAEARLARALAEGLNLEQAADRLGVKLGTVRTRLKSIFEKTGTHRQAELVQLILTSVVPSLV